MRLLQCSAGLALYALLCAGCETTNVGCDTPGAAGTGSCQMLACPGTMRDCKNGVADGCETDTALDINNCGACGSRCSAPANGEAACIDGVCGVRTCGVRFKDCNTVATDGCEIDSFRDANNCGACGNVCAGGPNATGVCVQGKCQLACQAAYLDCDSNVPGCETNGASDLNNCGTCGTTCTAVGATNAACAAGSCISTMCASPNRTCKAGPVDGCETDTSTSVSNCGTCGKQCGALPNATPGCAASNCGIGSCNTGYGNCDNAAANGCETNTTNNVANCGACGMNCPALANASVSCSASTCGLGACNAGYGNCDNNAANGCEISLTNDVANCGMCGKMCGALANATPGCAASTCGIGSCNTGYGNCDGNAANGCETNTTNNVANCGACGKNCPALANASTSCVASACGLGACNAGFGNCDNNAANGCESNLLSDASNCGMCGKACGAGQICSAGACAVGVTYGPVGPQTNVPVSTVTTGGWTQCYTELYNADIPITTVLAACPKAKLMLSCRPTGSTTLQLLAWAPRVDVIFDTGTGNTPHNANGSGWYFSGAYSCGFAKAGDPINRSTCDLDNGGAVDNNLRMCIHTAANQTNVGYRCGSSVSYSAAYQQLFYQAD